MSGSHKTSRLSQISKVKVLKGPEILIYRLLNAPNSLKIEEQMTLKLRQFTSSSFLENSIYQLGKKCNYEEIHKTIAKSLVPFHKQLSRVPTEQDREHLLSIPDI